MKKILKYFLLAFTILGISSVIINLVSVNNENKSIVEKIDNIENKISDLIDDNSSIKQHIDSLLTKDEIKDNDIKSLEDAINDLLVNISNIEKELNDLEITDNSLLDDLNSLKNSTESLKAELDSLKGDIESEKLHHFALVGSMNEWNVNDQTYLMNSEDNVVFTYTLDVLESVEFKITDNMAWEWQYGFDAVKSKGNYLTSSDGNIKITIPGKYDLSLNCETHELLIDIKEINLENYVETNNFTLVGSMNGWYVDNTEHSFISNNDYTYTYTFVNTIGEVEFKIVNNASWDTCYGPSVVSTTADWLDLTGDNIKITTYGEYTINFDYLRNDITISYEEIEPVDPVINVNIENGTVLTLGVDNDPIVEITGGIGIVRYHAEFQDLDGNYVSNLLSSLTPGDYIYRIITESDDFNNSVCLEVMVEVIEPYINFLTDDIFAEDINWSFNQVNFNSDMSSYTLSNVKYIIDNSQIENRYYITGVNDEGDSVQAAILYNDHLQYFYPSLNNLSLGVSYTFEEDITLNTLISFESVNSPLNLYIDVKNSDGISYLNSLISYNFDENNTSFIFNYSFKIGDTITLIFNKNSGENLSYLYYFNHFCFVEMPEVLMIDDKEYVAEENPTTLTGGYWRFNTTDLSSLNELTVQISYSDSLLNEYNYITFNSSFISNYDGGSSSAIFIEPSLGVVMGNAVSEDGVSLKSDYFLIFNEDNVDVLANLSKVATKYVLNE